MKNLPSLIIRPLLLAGMLASVQPVPAKGTAFTYQGQLQNNGSPANGLYDFQFRLAADPAGDTILATWLTNAIPVTHGLFTTMLDFGATPFNGSNYWVAVGVRSNDPPNTLAFTTLNPLQALTPA